MKMRSAVLSSLLLSALAGCPGAQLRDPKAPVSLGDWCQVVSSKMCELTAKACFNGMSGVADGCKDTAIPGCLAGRDPQTQSGRNGADLNACLAKLAPLNCGQLGAGMGNGELAICSANVIGSTPPTTSPPAPPDPNAPPTPTPPTNPPPPRPPVYTPSQPL